MCGVDGGLSAFTSSKFAGRPRKTRRRRRNERAQLRAVAPLLSVSAGGRRTSCAERVDVCVRECVRARLPANNLTSHGFCFFLNFNEKSTDNISPRFSITEAALYHTASPSNSRLLLWIIWTHIWVIY